MKKSLLLSIIITVFVSNTFAITIASPKRIYVDQNAIGTGLGLSWANAMTDFQTALDNATDEDSIFVAAGTYYPSKDRFGGTTTAQEATFFVSTTPVILGGFITGGSPLNQRNPTLNPTTLSGNLGSLGDSSDNAFHVLWFDHLDSTFVLDGFIITEGNANGSFADEQAGGAIYNDGSGFGLSSYPQIRNCIFSQNCANTDGGAIYNLATNGTASPIISNCSFLQNEATNNGGAIYNYALNGNASPRITRSTFSQNRVSNQGGAIANHSEGIGTSNTYIESCFFTGNQAGYGGAIINYVTNGGINTATAINLSLTANQADFGGGAITNWIQNSGTNTSQYINCSFSQNIAGFWGGAMSNHLFSGGSLNPTIQNCILWEDSAALSDPEIYANGVTVSLSDCLVQGGFASGTNVIDTDPLFEDPDGTDNIIGTPDDDLSLLNGSPVIDQGINSHLPSNINQDIVQANRISGIRVDLGAYEYSPCTFSARLYVDADASGQNTGFSWTDAFPNFQDAIDLARACGNIAEIWVAQGVYLPTRDTTSTQFGRHNTFYLPLENLHIYGGFSPGDSLLAQRDWTNQPSILSGDIGTPNDSTDNAYHVLFIDRVDSSTVIDGLHIMHGNANGSTTSTRHGGGVYNIVGANSETSFPVFRNCTFAHNHAHYGGAIANYASNAADVNIFIERSIFEYNSADSAGGAIYNYGTLSGTANLFVNYSLFHANQATNYGGAIHAEGNTGLASPRLINNRFYENTAAYGGAITNYGRTGSLTASIINSLFSGNAANFGGAIDNYGIAGGASIPQIINCTFSHNQAAANGGGISNRSFGGNALPTITNCILWGNGATAGEAEIYDDGSFNNVSDCLIENGYVNGTNIQTANPLFVDADGSDNIPGNLDDNLRLRLCSPAIETGNTFVNTSNHELDGNSRNIDLIDLGAYEHQGVPPISTLSQASQSILADVEYTDAQGWTHYFDCDNNMILLSIKKDGQNFGEINDGTFLVQQTTNGQYGSGSATNLSAAQYTTTGAWYVFNRHWDVTPNGSLSQPVKVRFYYTSQDHSDLIGSIPAIGIEQDMVFFKVDSTTSAHDLNVAPHNIHVYTHDTISSLSRWTRGLYRTIPYSEYEVASFSGGGGGGGDGLGYTPFPLHLLSFTGSQNDGMNSLQWLTAQEDGTQTFFIERSPNAQSFESIGSVPANGNNLGTTSYTFDDDSPLTGTNYYRLRILDHDGRISYSPILELSFSPEPSFALYPNPATTELTLAAQGLEAPTQFSLYAPNGKRIHQQAWTNKSHFLYKLDLSPYPKGLYIYQFMYNGESYQGKVIKQ